MSFESSKGRILIVDDESQVRELLSCKLMLEGFECATASSGKDALACFPKSDFDAVISDLRMPGMSGLELLDHVHRLSPHTAFVIATAEDDVRVGIEAMQRGAADYLVKPFQLAAVVASVTRALEKKRLEAELEKYRLNLERMVAERTAQLETAMKHIEQTYDETLKALGAALDLRDAATAGHSRRVSRYCMEIARAMGLQGEDVKHIDRGSYLHDIGKIGIPDSILRKPGPLTAEETAIMRTHVGIGYALVSRIDFLAPAAEMVLTHHERFDGSGYPQGLAGESIPIGSRVFAIADTLDAMTSDRPYRNALPLSDARDYIIGGSKRLFDPDIVHTFVSLPDTLVQQVWLEAAHASGPRLGASVNLWQGVTALENTAAN